MENNWFVISKAASRVLELGAFLPDREHLIKTTKLKYGGLSCSHQLLNIFAPEKN